jgi:hypothetical protein
LLKKLVSAIALLLSVHTANSQVLIALIFGDALNTGNVEFGLDGGFNWSSIQGVPGAKTLPIWNLGFYFDIKLKDPAWMIHTGVIVKSTMGTNNAPLYSLGDGNLDSVLVGGSVTTKLNYFNVPVMLKYKFSNNIYVEGGAMLGLMYGATDQFVNSVHEEEDLTYDRNVKSAYHPLDAGAMVGVGYRLLGGNGMNLGLRYYYGVVDVFIDDSTPGQYNRAIYLTLGIPIGGGK